jgi:hypothetical protein
VLIDGRRYSRLTRDLALAARDEGIPVTLITDPYCDWAPGLVTELFAVPTDLNHFWDTTSAMSSLIGLMVNGVFRELGAEVEGRMARVSALLRRFHRTYRPGAQPGQTLTQPTERTNHDQLFRKTLLSASVSLAALIAAQGALAQEAVFVMATNEVGAPTYNPIKATMLNTASGLLVRPAGQPGRRPVVSPLAGRKLGRSARRHVLDLQAEAGRDLPQRRALQRRDREGLDPALQDHRGRERLHGRRHRQGRGGRRHTVKFVMARPEPNLLYNLSSTFMSVVEPKSFAALGDNYGVTEVYGTGPFKLESFTIGQETVLVRNDDYTWGSPLAANRRPGQGRTPDLPRDPRGFDRLPGTEDRRRRHAAVGARPT